jgi:hypothetical protein
MLEKLAKKQPAVLSKIMVEAGYSKNSAINPGLNLTSKAGWQILKNELDANGAKIALNDLVSPENDDKRTRLSASVEILKIVSPEKQTNVIGLFEKLGDLQDDKSSEITE